MKIGLVGASNQERSLPFDAQRTVNAYPVLDQQGKEVSALYGTPGLTSFANTGDGAIRGMFSATNGRTFAVSANQVYEITSLGVATMIGSLLTISGAVSIDENGLQLAICDGTYTYIFTYATNVFVQVTDTDFPLSSSLTFIDGYFVVSVVNSGKFYISALYDGTSWGPLDFATAESSPDNLLKVINAVGQLWLMGNFSGEIWTNTGAAAFPFSRISGAKMEVGIIAPDTALEVDNSLFWVGQDKKGFGIVYRAQGFTPQRISTNTIERLIQACPTPSTLRAYSYQQDGHTFYVITGGGLLTTLVLDISTSLWHERAYLNDSGLFEQHLGSCGTYAFGLQLVGSRVNGKIYTMSLDVYSDDGEEIALERIYTHISDENTRARYNQLEIAMETGVGNQSDPAKDPQITLWISRDGGKTYSGGYTTSFGLVGQYKARAVFRRLGYAFDLTFKIRITDPVKRALIGSYLH